VPNDQGRIAACKIVTLPDSMQKGKSGVDLKALQKEVSVHKSLRNKYILEYIDSLMVKSDHPEYIPGLYMLMELATHGDLFDKIGG
jgi:serine/threonine-protein kinase Chk1